MKKIIGIALILLLFTSCKQNDSVVGSSNDTTINDLTFNVDTTYVDYQNSQLVAQGRVTNNSSSTITSPWYVEAQFYTGSSYTTKLGGNNTQIGVPLESGKATFWKITFSSTNVEVTKYPNFSVGDLRGIYKK